MAEQRFPAPAPVGFAWGDDSHVLRGGHAGLDALGGVLGRKAGGGEEGDVGEGGGVGGDDEEGAAGHVEVAEEGPAGGVGDEDGLGDGGGDVDGGVVGGGQRGERGRGRGEGRGVLGVEQVVVVRGGRGVGQVIEIEVEVGGGGDIVRADGYFCGVVEKGGCEGRVGEEEREDVHAGRAEEDEDGVAGGHGAHPGGTHGGQAREGRGRACVWDRTGQNEEERVYVSSHQRAPSLPTPSAFSRVLAPLLTPPRPPFTVIVDPPPLPRPCSTPPLPPPPVSVPLTTTRPLRRGRPCP